MEKHYNVVVGIANPDNVGGLMRVSCLLAAEFHGRVTAVTVVDTEHAQTPLETEHHDRMSLGYEMLGAAERVAERWDVPFSGRLVVVRGVAEALSEIAEVEHARVIVVGFSERNHPDGDDTQFARLIDDIAQQAKCNLLVARFRAPLRFDRVLVPVRRRLNLDIRRDLVTALHNQLGSTIEVVHFARSHDEVEYMHGILEEWLIERGVAEWVTLRVEVHAEPAQAIVDASAHYDAVVLGAAPFDEIRRMYFGAVPDYVARHAHCSTFMLRPHDVVSLP